MLDCSRSFGAALRPFASLALGARSCVAIPKLPVTVQLPRCAFGVSEAQSTSGRRHQTMERRAIATEVELNDSAYIDKSLRISGASEGPLAGLRFAVKDIFDVEGHVTGFGNPTWKQTHDKAGSTAKLVKAALAAGASLESKTHMDELAYSLNGENSHYGTPKNPRAPDRVPGGSSSGSAVAVANGDVDFALGTDTGGSIRVPASYCGVFGFRPTHGRVSLEGARNLAHSLDTGGWFTRDAALLRKIGDALLEGEARPTVFRRWLVAEDAFKLCFDQVGKTYFQSILPLRSQLEGSFGKLDELFVSEPEGELGDLKAWFEVFRIIQAAEAWEGLGGWVSEAKPEFGPGIKERFAAAAKISSEQVAENSQKREQITQRLDSILQQDGLLMVPAAPGPAPLLKTPASELEGFRSRLLAMTCIAGLGKLPQVTVPGLKVEGAPLGVGLIGPRGSDEALLEAAETISRMLAGIKHA